jgi:MoaA/NifB/PqqE/SkfB family radical SAM enzyme
MQWLSKLLSPFLHWIQVEVTSHCNAQCAYCPHTVYREFWQASHMPLELYKSLEVAFRRSLLVYLQGWGEPLAHPQFFEMAWFARHCGRPVGTTTNGMLVDERVADRLVDEGLSIVGFSLAGTDQSQDTIRRGTRFDTVLSAMGLLDEKKKRHASSLPEIHVAYLWLHSQFEAVRELPRLLEGRGVSQVVVSTLDFVPCQELTSESIRACNAGEETLLKGMISEVIADGKRRGVDIVFRLVTPFRTPGTCTENVTRALFISSRGLVSPCVFRNMPVVETSSRKDMGISVPKRLTFGNVHDRSLSGIWRDKSYRAFRREHFSGRGTHACGGCPKLFCVAQG